MKKLFFIKNLIMFLSLMIIPVLFFSFFSLYKVQSDIKKEVEEKSIAALSLSKSGIDIFFTDLYNYKAIIDSEPSTNLFILQALKDDRSEYESAKAQSYLKNYLFSMLSNKVYIHSIYLAVKDNDYFIADGIRSKIQDYIDKEWYTQYSENKIPQPYWIEPRKIKNYKFETDTTDVTSIFQYTKFNGMMVININQRYFNDYLDNVSIYEKQALVTLNQSNDVLFANKNFKQIPESTLKKAIELTKSNKANGASIDGYYVSFINSQLYNLNYLSFIPNNVIYKTTNIILRYTILAALISFVISCALAYFFTRQNYNQLNTIIKTFEFAEQGKTIPPAQSKKNNAYFYILSNVINVFVNQSYLKAQLESKKYSLLSAQLAALQYQINPHFLFNTLQSIDLEVLRLNKQPSFPNKMIAQLSSILRYSLNDPMELVTVAQEINITKNYIGIQKYRNNDKFEVFWEYSDEVLSQKTLRLLLQPILENSISHAYDGNNTLLIKIKISVKDSKVMFKIIDNGIGMSPIQLDKVNETLLNFETQDTGKHIGLQNINKRLCIKYSENCGIKIRSKLGLGTVISFMTTEDFQRD